MSASASLWSLLIRSMATHSDVLHIFLPKQQDNRWIPLESDPDVLNDWAQQVGLSTDRLSFQDIYGLDPELLALVPRPVSAVLLIFPTGQALEDSRLAAADGMLNDTHSNILFIKQKISNASGTLAVLHAVANASDVAVIPSSPLAQFLAQCKGARDLPIQLVYAHPPCKEKDPDERAHLLAHTALFSGLRKATVQASRAVITPDSQSDLHFVCFVHCRPTPAGSEVRLIELDGRREMPIDRGPSTDLLTDVAKVAQEKYLNSTNSLQFSMTALAPTES